MTTKTKTKRRQIDWDEINAKHEEQNNKKNYNKDDGFSEHAFIPKFTKDGIHNSIIRFLPRPEGDGTGIPFVKKCTHGFKDKGGWFINNCPTTLGMDCPTCKSNSALWDTKDPDDEALARKRGRRTNYFSNILVVKDPQHPENNGKVFIYKYGVKIYNKIMAKWKPEEGSIEEQANVFDYDEGTNFKLIIKRGADKTQTNYDDSKFVDGNTSVGTDAEINKIDSKLHPLAPIVAEKLFKSFDELKTAFQRAVGETMESPASLSEPAKAPVAEKPAEESFDAGSDSSAEEEDSFFADMDQS